MSRSIRRSDGPERLRNFHAAASRESPFNGLIKACTYIYIYIYTHTHTPLETTWIYIDIDVDVDIWLDYKECAFNPFRGGCLHHVLGGCLYHLIILD